MILLLALLLLLLLFGGLGFAAHGLWIVAVVVLIFLIVGAFNGSYR